VLLVPVGAAESAGLAYKLQRGRLDFNPLNKSASCLRILAEPVGMAVNCFVKSPQLFFRLAELVVLCPFPAAWAPSLRLPGWQ
jgi:hypothetical protein